MVHYTLEVEVDYLLNGFSAKTIVLVRVYFISNSRVLFGFNGRLDSWVHVFQVWKMLSNKSQGPWKILRFWIRTSRHRVFRFPLLFGGRMGEVTLKFHS